MCVLSINHSVLEKFNSTCKIWSTAQNVNKGLTVMNM
jgi:hypothetical protein